MGVSGRREARAHILAILRGIVSADAVQRASGADAATDLIDEYTDAEALTLTFALACAYEVEADVVAQEAQLHALAEFAESYALPTTVLQVVLEVEKGDLTGSAAEHLDYLHQVAELE